MINIVNGISGRYFSASIPDAVFSISGTRAGVEITVDGTQIYSEYLYPIEGKVKIYAMSNLLTPYARMKLMVSVHIQITEEFADSTPTSIATMDAQVVYCEADISTSADDFTTRHFLSLHTGIRTTAWNRQEYLHYLGTDTAKATAYYDDDTMEDHDVAVIAGNDVYTTIDVSPRLFDAEGKKLIAYTVHAGQREQMYRIDFNNPDCAPILLFDNSFGVEEMLYCTGIATVSPSYKSDTAYIEGYLKTYNIEETRVFKADTGVMTFDDANWAAELFRSRFIRIVNFFQGTANVGREVIITDSKSEYTNADSEMPRFTFSYQYSQRNHNVLDLMRAGRIFDNTFDNTFE